MPLRIWSSLIAAAFLLIASAASSSAEEVTINDQSAVKNVISDQISAFQETDYDRAFSHAAPSIRNSFQTTEQFMAMVKGGYDPLYDPDYYNFGRNTFLNGEIYQEVIATDRNGKQWQAVYTLKQQPDGSWKITGVKMEPYSGAST